MSRLARLLAAILALLAVPAAGWFPSSAARAADGQPYVLDDTQVWPVPDVASGRDYQVFVSLPPSYRAQAGRRYPVLFVADADYGFPLIRSIVRRVNLDGPVTDEFILVGLSYAKGEDGMTSRRRDYTPVAHSGGEAGRFGGGPAYQLYLRDVVLPFVEAKFRTDPARRAFMGHSYGALLGAQILLSEPEMFRSYILGSPSLWFGNHAIFDLEAAYAASARDLSADVFLYVGEFEAAKPGDRRYNRTRDMVKDNAVFAGRLKSRGYKSLRLRSEVIAGENHLTVFPTGFTRGIIDILPYRP